MKIRLATSLLRLILPTVVLFTVRIDASFGPFGKWKVENANSYIIYNGIYIPNPEQMIEPGSILDSLNPVSSFSNLWKSVPSFGIFGGGGGEGDQYNNPYAQYGDQYPDASTFPGSYDSPQPSGSEPMSTVMSPDPSSSPGLSGLFGFGGGSDTPSDPSATFSAEDAEASSGGFSSYLPWNWFSGNSRSTANLGATNQLPDEFSFLLDGPFQMNRRSDVNPVDDHVHVPEKEKVSVYLRPIGQGSFLRYELHEPISPTDPNVNQPKQQGPAPVSAAAPVKTGQQIPNGRKRRSVSDEDLVRTPSKYVPRLFRKRAPPTPPALPAKKSSVQYNRRRYQQLQKQKKYFKSSSRSPLSGKAQKIKKSDDMIDMDADFPCPKTGIWNYNGEVCIAVGPTPTWACKPNDLVASGKLVICRNKILMS